MREEFGETLNRFIENFKDAKRTQTKSQDLHDIIDTIKERISDIYIEENITGDEVLDKVLGMLVEIDTYKFLYTYIDTEKYYAMEIIDLEKIENDVLSLEEKLSTLINDYTYNANHMYFEFYTAEKLGELESILRREVIRIKSFIFPKKEIQSIKKFAEKEINNLKAEMTQSIEAETKKLKKEINKQRKKLRKQDRNMLTSMGAFFAVFALLGMNVALLPHMPDYFGGYEMIMFAVLLNAIIISTIIIIFLLINIITETEVTTKKNYTIFFIVTIFFLLGGMILLAKTIFIPNSVTIIEKDQDKPININLNQQQPK